LLETIDGKIEEIRGPTEEALFIRGLCNKSS